MRLLPCYAFALVLGCHHDPVDPGASNSSSEGSTTATTQTSTGDSDSSASAPLDTSTGEVDTGTSEPATTQEPPCGGAGCACEGACDADLECGSAGFCVRPGMVWVPEGEFLRGCTIDDEPTCDEDEGPRVTVFVSAYAIDRSEVTEAEYAACVAAGSCPAPECLKGIGEKAYDPVNNGDLPVDCVSWDMASAYCAWVDKRLPTEAQWEKAARGVDGRRFSWGDAPEPGCDLAIMAENKKGCDVGDRWAVGSKLAGNSPYGAVDMLGNVSEWVSDWYAVYDPRELIDPAGPAEGTLRVARGGSFNSTGAANLRTTFRVHVNPQDQHPGQGFRCASID